MKEAFLSILIYEKLCISVEHKFDKFDCLIIYNILMSVSNCKFGIRL